MTGLCEITEAKIITIKGEAGPVGPRGPAGSGSDIPIYDNFRKMPIGSGFSPLIIFRPGTGIVEDMNGNQVDQMLLFFDGAVRENPFMIRVFTDKMKDESKAVEVRLPNGWTQL